jgi:type IV secretory pathway VirB10-like protein
MRGQPRPDRNDRDSRSPSSSSSGSGGMNAQASKQYRAALDALFAKGEVGKLAEKMTPNGPRLDPHDLVRGGTGRPNDPPATSAPTPSATPAPTIERVQKAPAAPPPPPKDDARAVLRKKVLEALGRDEISRAIDRYVKAHGWPNDFEILEQALEHNKPDRQAEAMAALEKLLEREKPKRSRTLAGKLRLIEETSDGDLRDAAARIRAKL